MSAPVLKLRVQFNNVGTIQGGTKTAYANLLDSDGALDTASHLNINAPKANPAQLAVLDPEKLYEVTFTEIAKP